MVPAFKAVLQQTRSALQPSNKAAAPTHVRPSQGPDVDRRALASGLLALLQHAGTLAVVDPSLRSALLVEVVEGLRQQPWLWELFLRRHFSLLLSQPLAAELLVEGIAQLDSAVQARCMASLCGALRRWPGAATPQHAATVLRLRKAALGMVRSCFRIVSHELPGLAPGQPRSLGSLGLALATTSTEVHVALEPHLPSAMQLLLYNSPASGQANAGAVLPSSSAASGVSDGGAESGAASSASADVAESAAVYAATLAAQLCDVEALGRMLSLGETQQPQHGDGQQEGCEGAVRLNERSEQRVHVALHVIPVLVEALCGDPSLAERVGSQGQHGGGHLEGTEESTGGLPSHVTLVSCLLAVRWELCQLLVATAASKPPSKWKPAAWTPATCSALLEAMTAVRATPGPHPNAALVMPPAIVAHGLELMREALPSWLGSGAGGGDRLDPDMVTFLQRVLFLQGACYAGVFQPHAAVEDGPAHHEAMVTAQKLRELLVSGAQAGAKGAGTAGVPCGTGTGGKPKGSRKRQGGRGKDAHEQSAKQLKAGNAEGESDDAVADLLDLLTAPPQAASAGAVQEAPSTTTDALTSTYVHLTSSAPQSDSLPTAQAPHLASAGSIPAATSPAAAKPRKRITPQAMGAAPALPAAAIAHSERVQASGDEPINSAVGADPFAIDPGRSWGTGRVVMASTVDMDDVAREAMWAAYIADKERLVELLGVSRRSCYCRGLKFHNDGIALRNYP